ncbi:hypothetical protein Lser_V15G18853 [Lactuca serriola]
MRCSYFLGFQSILVNDFYGFSPMLGLSALITDNGNDHFGDVTDLSPLADMDGLLGVSAYGADKNCTCLFVSSKATPYQSIPTKVVTKDSSALVSPYPRPPLLGFVHVEDCRIHKLQITTQKRNLTRHLEIKNRKFYQNQYAFYNQLLTALGTPLFPSLESESHKIFMNQNGDSKDHHPNAPKSSVRPTINEGILQGQDAYCLDTEPWKNLDPSVSTVIEKHSTPTTMHGTMSPAGVGFSYSNRSSDYTIGYRCYSDMHKLQKLSYSSRLQYPIASEERQHLSSSNSGAVSTPLFVDTLQRVGAEAELMLYEGKTHTDVFVQSLWQILWLKPMAPMKFTNNNLSLKKHHVEFVQYRVSVVASELLSHCKIGIIEGSLHALVTSMLMVSMITSFLRAYHILKQAPFLVPFTIKERPGSHSLLNKSTFKRHFLRGIDQLRPGIGLQVHKPNLKNPNQFYLASQQHQHQQQQQVLTHAQAQGKLGASPNYGFSRLSRGNIIMKDGQPLRNEGSNGIFKNAKNIERLKKYFDIRGGPATFIQIKKRGSHGS